MDDSKWERYSALGGVAFAVLIAVAGFLPGSPPKTTDSAAKIARFFTDHGDAIRWSAYLGGLGTITALWWSGAVWRLLRRAEGGIPRLAVVALGGIVFAAAISRFASLLDSLAHGFFDQPDFTPILERDLENGQHRNPTGKSDYFTTAFFHRPDELVSELSATGFRLQELTAIEGPGWLAKDFDRLWADRGERERLLQCVRKVEHEPALLVVSSHIMAIGKK